MLSRDFLLWCLLGLSTLVVKGINIDKDGGYVVTVAIDQSLGDQDKDAILKNLKELYMEASKTLQTAIGQTAESKNKLYFAKLQVLVPENWQVTPVATIAPDYLQYDTADIRVTASDKPVYTKQPGACGQPALYTQYSTDFIKNKVLKDSKVTEEAKKEAIHHWAKLRFGVFDEYGDGDYSSPFYKFYEEKTEIRPTFCINSANFLVKFKNDKCKLEQYGLYPGSCQFELDARIAGNNEPIFTNEPSLMSITEQDAVTLFCNDITHRADVLTRQQIFCNKDVMSIIKEHNDYKLLNTTEKELTIDYFKINTVNGARFTVFLDGSADKYMDQVQSALSRWVAFDISNENNLEFKSFATKTPLSVQGKTIKADTDRSALITELEKFFTDIKANRKNPECIRKEIEKLTDDKDTPKSGGSIVLITNELQKCEGDDNDVAKLDLKGNVLHLLAFNIGDKGTFEKLYQLAKETGGNVHIPMGDELQEYLYGLKRWQKTSDEEQKSEIVQYWPKINTKTYIPINLDSKNVEKVQLHLNGEFKQGDTVLLQTLATDISNDTCEFEADSKQWKCNDVTFKGKVIAPNYHKFDIAINKAAKYNLLIKEGEETKPVANKIIFGQVKQVTNEPLSIRAHILSPPIVNSATKDKVVIVAEVPNGQDINVKAEVFYLNSPNQEPVAKLQNFVDNGVGNPDTYKDDGLYSKYVSNIANGGYHTIKLIISGEANGALVQRKINTGLNFYSSGSVPYEISGQIVDLKLAQVNRYTVNIQWSAPGEVLDSGTVEKYSLAIGKTQEEVDKKEPTLVPEDFAHLGQPKYAGMIETAYIDFDNYLREPEGKINFGEHIYLQVRAELNGRTIKSNIIKVLGNFGAREPINRGEGSKTTTVKDGNPGDGKDGSKTTENPSSTTPAGAGCVQVAIGVILTALTLIYLI